MIGYNDLSNTQTLQKRSGAGWLLWIYSELRNKIRQTKNGTEGSTKTDVGMLGCYPFARTAMGIFTVIYVLGESPDLRIFEMQVVTMKGNNDTIIRAVDEAHPIALTLAAITSDKVEINSNVISKAYKSNHEQQLVTKIFGAMRTMNFATNVSVNMRTCSRVKPRCAKGSENTKKDQERQQSQCCTSYQGFQHSRV